MSNVPFLGLHQLFERQAALTPHNIALCYQDQRMSYRELDEHASAVAQRLVPYVRAPGQMIGLCMERSCELIVGMLAILKAGATYVPIDPDYPAARIAYLIDDARVHTVLTSATGQLRLPGTTCVTIELAAEPGPAARGVPVTANESAYVIYTSGSTGQPKGVVIEHGNVTRLFDSCAARFAFSERDVWTMFHSISFDFSVWEIWGALLHGGELVVVPSAVAAAPGRFAELVEARCVSVLSQTPTAFSHFTQAAIGAGRTFPALRRVVMGGERLEASHLTRWFGHYSEQQTLLVNMYGITETTVHVTYRELSPADAVHGHQIPIGEPLADLQVHLLNAEGQPVAEGETGEIVVSGAGVARGYLRRPELNAERFVLMPLGSQGQMLRTYRSGDLAVRRDGELMYVGRADDQVKLRGYRIELHEVEYQLGMIPGVESCMVVVQDLGDGDKRLLAFFVAAAHSPGIASAVMAEAASRLPPHMLPARCVEVNHIPLTSHGKRNGQELMNQMYNPSGSAAGAPQKSSVTIVAEICRTMLGEQDLSWDIDLFDQGATSLSLSRIILELNSQLDLRLTGIEFDGDCSIMNIATVVNRQSTRSTQIESAQ